MTKPIRIGCYSAFYGDSPEAAVQLVKHEGSSLDYLVADYLAEITMGIFAIRRKQRRMMKYMGLQDDGSKEYVAQFPNYVLRRILPDAIQNGTKIVTNAGALNPILLKEIIEELLVELNIPNVKVAAVVGDDLMASIEENGLSTVSLSQFKNFTPFSPVSPTKHQLHSDRLPDSEEPIVSLHAYLGARGICAALDAGAQIVITGRVVDSALVVGPLMHEFEWNKVLPPYDLLASASLAGHIIECGCHATGGNFTDWRLAANSNYGGFAYMGYPIVEFDGSSGEFVVTKPERTGGLVSVATVSEQILYESLDPALYILPDVILDLRQINLTQIGPDRVLVRGAQGRAPTPWLKCCGIFMDGWKLSGQLVIGGHEAKEKAEAVGRAVRDRVNAYYKENGMPEFRDFNIEAVGGESLYGPSNSKNANEIREVVLRMTGHHDDPEALKALSIEFVSPVTNMVPGITGFFERAKPFPNLIHFPGLYPKAQVETILFLDNQKKQVVPWGPWDDSHSFQNPTPVSLVPEAIIDDKQRDIIKVKLIDLAYGRSGDKGDVSNIGIIARDPTFYPYIKRSLTAQVVSDYMQHVCKGTVVRYDLPGLLALNFVLTATLGGGGLSSMVIDRQGKTYAQLLLTGLEIEIPSNLVRFSKL
ncbi:uncharacterized protein ATC70_007881 [Mucor velutinosus]|uniref:Terpene utilization protein AtuA n=1 Tax=Mucor velutinosus TaxID=708070 RepID=A0AAN7D3I8_9FUNG|nr:hypothetical protein ATC70_007881 [Mucor velutinosus]